MALVDGLERWYPLDGNGDDVHGGINATISGPSPTWAAGHISAQALDLTASASNKCRADPYTPSQFSCSFWVYRTASATLYYGLIGNMRAAAVTDNWFFLASATNQLEWYSSGNSATARYFTLNLNTWEHVVITQSASNAIIYVNGVSVSNTITGPVSTVSPIDFLMASRNDAYGNFPCYMQEVALWNRALSPSEVTQLYNSGTGLSYAEASAIPYDYIAHNTAEAQPASAMTIEFSEFDVIDILKAKSSNNYNSGMN